jgi:hypothetical protein
MQNTAPVTTQNIPKSGKKVKQLTGNSTQQKEPAKRGRKLNSQTKTGLTQEKLKLIKTQTIGEEISESPIVLKMGNTKVTKGTEEYEKKREDNNEAVRKCREKSKD